MAESELISSALNGSQNAFAALVEAHQAAVYNLTRRMLGDVREAEDATQETFLRAYRQLHRYDPARPFKTWLLAIANHHCIDLLRKRHLRWLSLDEVWSSDGDMWRATTPDPEEVALQHERRDEITTLLNGLASKDRNAVVLLYWCDLSYAEIADVFGATVSAVKSRLHRARMTLDRQIIAETRTHERRQAQESTGLRGMAGGAAEGSALTWVYE